MHSCRHGSFAATLIFMVSVNAATGDETAPTDYPAPNDQQTTLTLVNQVATNSQLFTFDYGVPHSPALTLAGLADTSLKPSTSLKPFVLSFPGLLGGNSDQDSAALDLAPAWAFGGEPLVDLSRGARGTSCWDEDNSFGRIWNRTRIGMALYKGQSNVSDPGQTKPSRAALGISASLLDGSDPIMATQPNSSTRVWANCITSKASDLAADVRDPTLTTESSEIDASRSGLPGVRLTDDRLGQIEADLGSKGDQNLKDAAARNARTGLKRDTREADDEVEALGLLAVVPNSEADRNTKAHAALDECRKQASDAAEHGYDLEVGAGIVWSGDPGKWANFGNPNAAIWTSGRFPLYVLSSSLLPCEAKDNPQGGRSELACWMIGGTGRYSAGEMVSTGDDITPEIKANVLEGWLGLERIDSKSKFGGYFGYLQQHATDSAQDQFSKGGTRWLVSAAFNLGGLGGAVPEGLWIQGSYGAANGSVTTLDEKVALLSLSFGPPSLGSTFQSPQTGAPNGNRAGGEGANAPANGNGAPPTQQ